MGSVLCAKAQKSHLQRASMASLHHFHHSSWLTTPSVPRRCGGVGIGAHAGSFVMAVVFRDWRAAAALDHGSSPRRSKRIVTIQPPAFGDSYPCPAAIPHPNEAGDVGRIERALMSQE